jgi:hypothetical protein
MKTKICQLVLPLLMPVLLLAAGKKPARDYYQIIIYHFKTEAQEKAIDAYIGAAFLPAAHRLGIASVGVFKPLANDTSEDKRVYVLLPFKSEEQLMSFPGKLDADAAYTTAAASWLDVPYNEPAYTRMESIWLQAFPMALQLQLPKLNSPLASHIYELRSYESPTEKLFRNKVHMFNEGGEVPLFKRLNFNAVFYASVIHGSRMPNLMYMTSFEDMADRDAHWKTFSADPEWKKLSSMPFYQHNVSRNETIFLRATPYSDY